jgi:hypothetical protein
MVSYEYTMPKQSRTLSEFPKNYLGDYTEEEDSTATLNISESSFTTPEFVGTIGDNLELKPYMGYLVINLTIDGVWTVYLAKMRSDGNIEVFNIDPTENEIMTQLAEITSIEKVYNEENELERVHIDPSDGEFKEMIDAELFESIGLFVPVE